MIVDSDFWLSGQKMKVVVFHLKPCLAIHVCSAWCTAIEAPCILLDLLFFFLVFRHLVFFGFLVFFEYVDMLSQPLPGICSVLWLIWRI